MIAPCRLVPAARCEGADAVVSAVEGGERRVELIGPWDEFVSCVGGSNWMSLKGLSIVGCGLDENSLNSLSTNLPPGVTALGVSGNSGLGLETWRRFWKNCPGSVAELDLGFNRLGQDALVALCESFLMVRGSSLSELRLDGNDFQSLEPMRPALGAMPRLVKLDMCNNALDDEGLLQFAQALPRASIRRLHFSDNTQISSRGASALFNVLPRAEAIEAIFLDGTSVGESSLQILQQRLANSSLQELDLRETEVTDAGLQALAEAIPGSRLQKLYITKADFASETIDALAEAFGGEVQGKKENSPGLLKNTQNAALNSGELSLSAAVLRKAPRTWEARSYLQRQKYRQIPGRLKGINRRLEEELEYVSKLATLDKDEPKTRLVRLFTEEEKVALRQGLQSRFAQVQAQYEQDLTKASKSAYPGVKDCVKKRYEPQLSQMLEDIKQMQTQTYIFVDRATPRAA